MALVAMALAGAMTAAVMPAGRAVAAPPFSLDERAAAITSPSLVFLQARAEGYLKLKSTGALVESNPVTVTRECSGFVVNTNGYVVTAARCVQPTASSMRDTAASLVADDLIRDKKLTSDQRSGLIQDATSNTDFVGDGAAAPTIKVYAQLFIATGGPTSAPAIAAHVVSTQSVSMGDVALVKLAQQGLPVAQVGTAVPAVDSHVVQLAFGTPDASTATATFTVRSTGATLVGPYQGKSPPMYRMDADLGAAAYGGMVLDQTGQVVGMINADTAKDKVNHLMSDVATIRKLMDSAGVHNQQSTVDRDYAAGLDAYFAGRYTAAIKKFDAVLAASPNNKVARSYRDQAELRLSIEGDAGAGIPWMWIAVAGSGLVIVGGLLAAVLAVRRRAGQRRAVRLGLAVDPFAPPTQGPFPPAFNPVSGMPYSVSGTPFPVSGTPYSVAPVSAAPGPQPPVAHEPATDGAGHVEAPVESITEDTTPKWAGIPVPVSPPHGIAVQHPTWPAPTPMALPEPLERHEAAAPGPVPAGTIPDQATPPPPIADSSWAAPPRQPDQTDPQSPADGSQPPDQPES